MSEMTLEEARRMLRERRWTGGDRGDADEAAILGALDGLVAIGEPATAAFAEVLPHAISGNTGITQGVLIALRAMIPEVVARSLVDAVVGKDKAMRKLAIAVVCDLPRALQPVIAALGEHPVLVDRLLALAAATAGWYDRGHMLAALAKVAPKDPRVLAAFTAAAADPEHMLRGMLPMPAVAFGDAAIPMLVMLSRDLGDADRSAVSALDKIGTPAALAAVRKIASASAIASAKAKAKAKTTKPKPKPRK